MVNAAEKNAAARKTTARTRTRKAPAKPKTALADALAKVAKDFDLNFDVVPEIEHLSTGNVALDFVTTGGFPVGKIVEVYGLQASGKTTSVLQLAARIQSQGKHVVYLDYEQSLDPTYCKTLGLNILDESTFHVSQPDTFEQGMNALKVLISSGEVALVIVDSVASMVIEKEMDADAGEGVGAMQKARLMAQELRKLPPLLREHGTCLVFLNHVRDVIDMSPIGQKLSGAGVQRKTTPGGSALKFAASLRLFFKVKKQVTADRWEPLGKEYVRTPIGAYVEVKAEKNKTGIPFRKADLMMRFGEGFSAEWSVLQVLLAYGGVKKKSGGYYEFAEDLQWEDVPASIQGEDNVVRRIAETPDWFEHLSVYAQRYLDEAEDFEVQATEPDEVEDGDMAVDPSPEVSSAEVSSLLEV